MRKADMAAKSGVFADMFEVGEAEEVAEVPLTESSEVLEAMLRMCAGGNFALGDLGMVRALHEASDKYQVSSLVRAFGLARDLRRSLSSQMEAGSAQVWQILR